MAGALYLIGSGIVTIARSSRRPQGRLSPDIILPRIAFTSNVAVGIFHPKTILFFVAFVPQFISTKENYTTQASILVLTFGVAVACTDTIYAISAAGASSIFKRSGASHWAERASGGVLIAAGVATAAGRD